MCYPPCMHTADLGPRLVTWDGGGGRARARHWACVLVTGRSELPQVRIQSHFVKMVPQEDENGKKSKNEKRPREGR